MGLAIKQNFRHDRPPIAIGSATFTEFVRDSNIFIDKTLLIDDILDDLRIGEVITLPRHWGKTIGLDMIKTFVEMHIDANGTQIAPNTTANYRLFMYGEVLTSDGQVDKLISPLLISKHIEMVDQFFGQHPVIHISLQNIRGSTFWELTRHLISKIRKVFHHHDYMIGVFEDIIRKDENRNYTRQVIKYYVKFCDIVRKQKRLNRREVQDAIPFLTKILRRHFQKKPIIFIDDYLNPILKVFTNIHFPAYDKERFLKFYSDFLGISITENEHYEKAFLTGLYPFPEEFREIQLGAVTRFTFHSAEKVWNFGFHEWELNNLFEYLKIPNDTLSMLKSYYGYYHFPFESVYAPFPLVTVHPMWPIANYLADRQLKSWINTHELTNFLGHFLPNEMFRLLFYFLYVTDRQCNIQIDATKERIPMDQLDLLIRATVTQPGDPIVSAGLDVPIIHNASYLEKTQIAHMGIMFLYTLGYLSMNPNGSRDTVGTSMTNPGIQIRNCMREIYWKLNYTKFPEFHLNTTITTTRSFISIYSWTTRFSTEYNLTQH